MFRMMCRRQKSKDEVLMKETGQMNAIATTVRVAAQEALL
jgi:hypothetical protein